MIANEARKFLDQADGDAAMAKRFFDDSNPVDRFAGPERDEVRKVIDAAAMKPTRNFVVFDDKLIDIVRKYGVAGLFTAGLTAQQVDQFIEQHGDGTGGDL
mgnify:CR=1 FL=1